jgi:hypothetical protein
MTSTPQFPTGPQAGPYGRRVTALALAAGVDVTGGEMVPAPVAETHGLPFTGLSTVLS